MVDDRPLLRPAEQADAEVVAELLHATAGGLYDVYSGGRGRALAILRAAFARPGNSASAEVVTVAELDGRVAGAIAAFPVDEANPRATRFLRLTLARTPPWRWPRTLRVSRAGAEATPLPPPDALYVDALATARRFRRRGVATALLDVAEARARALGLAAVALDTAARNAGARALYEATGFIVSERRPTSGGVPEVVAYQRALRSPS